MSVQNIGRVDRIAQQSGVSDVEQQQLRRRLDLHRSESFERGRSTTDLSSFHSAFDPKMQNEVRDFYARFNGEQRQTLQAASQELGAALLNAAASGPTGATGSTSGALEDATSSTLTIYLTTTGADDAAQVNNEFMYMAVDGMETYLNNYAQKAQQDIELGKETRTQMTELRDMLADWPEGETQSFTWTEVTYDENGKPTVTEHTENLTKEQAEELMQKLETQLSNCQDTSEISKFDLQKVYQDYQQAVQTLAGIMKQVHDDAMKIIGNVRN